MLDRLSDWISEELIALEKNATALFRAWKDDSHGMDCSFNTLNSFSCLSMVTTRLCIVLDADREQLAKSSWFWHSRNLSTT